MKLYLVLLVGSLTATLCACLSETDPSAYNALDYASMTGKYDSRYMPFAGSYAYRPYYATAPLAKTSTPTTYARSGLYAIHNPYAYIRGLYY